MEFFCFYVKLCIRKKRISMHTSRTENERWISYVNYGKTMVPENHLLWNRVVIHSFFFTFFLFFCKWLTPLSKHKSKTTTKTSTFTNPTSTMLLLRCRHCITHSFYCFFFFLFFDDRTMIRKIPVYSYVVLKSFVSYRISDSYAPNHHNSLLFILHWIV